MDVSDFLEIVKIYIDISYFLYRI